MSEPATVALSAIRALERRELEVLGQLYHPQVSFHWQPGLPYSGDFHGPEIARMSETFARIWTPLQPDEATRQMHPRVIASAGSEVVVEYAWRGRRPDGATFETHTLARYQVRDGLLFDARMYYYDLAGLIAFIKDKGARIEPRSRSLPDLCASARDGGRPACG